MKYTCDDQGTSSKQLEIIQKTWFILNATARDFWNWFSSPLKCSVPAFSIHINTRIRNAMAGTKESRCKSCVLGEVFQFKHYDTCLKIYFCSEYFFWEKSGVLTVSWDWHWLAAFNMAAGLRTVPFHAYFWEWPVHFENRAIFLQPSIFFSHILPSWT